MLVIGLTGGIGSGKSTVASLFSELNVPIIDADVIARQAILASTTNQELSKFFGPLIFNEEGTLNRHKLRQLIFNDPDKKKWLEELLHPIIVQEIKNQLSTLNAPYCIVIIPLLAETGPYTFIDRILVVDAHEETCLERARARDKTSTAELQKIINSQATRETRLALANEVILNQGNLDELRQQVKNLNHSYLQLTR